MWYKEFLAVRRPLAAYAIVIALVSVFNAWGAGDNGGIILSQAIAVSTGATSILALVLGTHLENERTKSGRSALLRPISRAGYAVTVFTVDAIALAVAYTGTVLLIAGIYEAAHHFAAVDTRGVSLLNSLALPVGAIAAWYAISTACGVGFRSKAANVLVGPISLALWCGAAVYTWHAAAVFRLLCIVNPIAYFIAAVGRIEQTAHPGMVGQAGGGFYNALPIGTDTAVLFLLAAAGFVLATLAWKRAEVFS